MRWWDLTGLVSHASGRQRASIGGPIRGELLGSDALAERARVVARGQILAERSGQFLRAPLLARLKDTERILEDIHARLSTTATDHLDLGTARDWLLDNFYIVEEDIREVRQTLPRGYYRELPELDGGLLAGYPRVYELAITLISHTEGRIDLDNLILFVNAFQQVSPLTIGELWALPAMLRLGLLENVRRMALRTVQRLDEIRAADRWIDRIRTAGEKDALGVAITALSSDSMSLRSVFTSRFLRQLHQEEDDSPIRRLLERWMIEEGIDAGEAEARATQRLALTQLIMANSITSLRTVSRMDWRAVVEAQSGVEAVLRKDPSSFYPLMTFATRDRYRHVVERLARRSGLSETHVAQSAVDLAGAVAAGGDARGHESSSQPRDARRTHVGYYLVDEGRSTLERAIGYGPSVGDAVYRQIVGHPNAVFFGGVFGGSVAVLVAIVELAGSTAWEWTLLIVLLALIPATEVAVRVVNQLVTAWMRPRPLPRLDFRTKSEIPPEFRTAIVIPTLFDSVAAVTEALENIEVQYLANREKNLHFAILSDFTDAPTARRDEDAAIVTTARSGVRALNARYATEARDAFYLFHRQRRWNAQEGVWMGWERKRGKLAEFNHFLRGAEGAFTTIEGNTAPLRQVRNVITLDADTVLPPGAVPDLVGALAHPLNRADYDPASGRVTLGYGILQPRVGVSLPSAHKTRFAEIHSGHPGVDPYTTAVSDVYQDLFGEGSFTGKGIYDVDAFEQSTHGRFAENTLLSHDLIEGNYARAGLDTSVIVYDDYPARYLTFTRRKHRWIRGDWQLLDWLTPTVPGPNGPERNRLSFLSRWKIFDNLRRSVLEIGLLVLLLAGWTVLPGSPLQWTFLVLSMVAVPWILSLLLALGRPPLDKSWLAYYAAVGRDAKTSAQQLALSVTFLPHQAIISADAILRTLWRIAVSRRHLLEWQTASTTEQATANTAAYVWRMMLPVTLFAAAILAAEVGIEIAVRPGSTPFGGGPDVPYWHRAFAVLPLAVLWLISPSVAHFLSRSRREPRAALTPEMQQTATRYALLHWRYFERFANVGTQWLAPDNFQEDPEPIVAMRTSPTNVGLQLLSTTSAYDLGFITVGEMADTLERVFETLERMRRFRGHFFNWYDLHDLRVLEPSYISTVDSGNLSGHLVALRQACLSIPDDSFADARIERAIDAALALAEQRLQGGAFEDAYSEVRRARAHLAGADGKADMELLVAGAARALRHVRRAGHEPESPPAEWLEWTIQRIEAGRLEAPRSPDRESSPPTLRRLAEVSEAYAVLVARLESIAHRAYELATGMDFRFLYDDEQKLFSIGYDVGGHALDASFYDLLASEVRLTSFIAVAKGDVPVEHWFALGRTLTRTSGETALVSWSGSMFEYLMPSLVMRSFPDTLLSQTFHGAVRRQITYAEAADVPWGASESAYNRRDRHLTYQYRAFGVPDLALKRGLGRDLVIAPYASALAMMVDPHRALVNLVKLEKAGALGAYGFRDALDYTRPDPGRRYAVVRNYMAHHVGMGLVALTNALAGMAWQHRFHADALVRAAELLLYERIPRRLVLQSPQTSRADEALPDPEHERPAVREVATPQTAEPRVALLGRLPYTILVTNAGSGYSRYEDIAVTRWRADGTADNTGQFCYLKDLTTGRVWSAAHQPTCTPADNYRALLGTDRVTFHRVDGPIETMTEITVVPEDSAEVRRVTVTNRSGTPRDVELTSYGEIVLAGVAADRAHPAFSNLFVETEWHAWCTAVTATRRPRSADEPSLWCVHVVDAGKHGVGPATCETDRARFIGRGRSVRTPVALERDGALSGTTGAVLDPIFALRVRLHLGPGQSAAAAFTTLVAPTLDRAFDLADRYHGAHAAQRALDLAWVSTQVELRELGVTPSDSAIFQELAGRLFYPSDSVRAPQEERDRNRGSQPLLWSVGLSGDWPILLAVIKSSDGLPTLRQLLSAHRYWRRRGMMVDLVIVNAHPPTYLQELNESIVSMLFALHASDEIDRSGGVFIRRLDQLATDALLMLRTTAPVHVICDGSALSEVLDIPDLLEPPETALEKATVDNGRRRSEIPLRRIEMAGEEAGAALPVSSSRPPRPENGFGRMLSDGRYEIRVWGDEVPPAPWANVVANARGGFVVSERGAGFCWAESSYFFRLTPWHNDPVADPPEEVLYLRDDETLDLWSATPAPIGREIAYVVRHGAGFTTFEHGFDGIGTHLRMTMASDVAVKLSVLRLTNESGRTRRLTITGYAAWTLGILREHTQHQVRTFARPEEGAVFAENTFEPHFAGQVAFCALSEPLHDFTGSRRAFVGRNGTLADPEGLRAGRLGRTMGKGIDPCAALQCRLELAPGETREIVFMLGAAEGQAEASRLVARYGDLGRARAAAARSEEAWTRRLSVISVRTPEHSFDAMLNHWALYQSFACRMWARSALYQSGGAYGFRDQLQDVLAFLYAEPDVAREHILRAASRQFVEGDVQHWWHPHNGSGVRTRFSDDLVWLPYAVDHYVRVTGDRSVLEEYVPFLAMRQLEPHEHEVYDQPQVTDEHGSIYEHCLRALDRACTRGIHDLPLIGIGDWNDGMNRVGVEGKGESVWLAWFLLKTLRAFSEHADARADDGVAQAFRERADAYAAAVEAHGWDGSWYRRAYFDDGSPLGSAENSECRIDAIAQSWSVISGAGDPNRRERAMRSFEEYLVREEDRLIQLLTPAFDEMTLDPGYIKGYLPGVRENGAQYTHAALWSVLATALQGRGDRAFELFQMINPLTRTITPEEVATYKVEPYVVAADVYTAEGHVGRGGWTWYTGSAGWMYRIGIEAILGFKKRGNVLFIEPRVPAAWPEYVIEYRFGESLYVITVRDAAKVDARTSEIHLDGSRLEGSGIPLVDDGARHNILVKPQDRRRPA
jgi:cellobiose phosphorylase